MHELLTPDQMSKADALTIKGGIPGIDLMQKAGEILFAAIEKHFPEAQRILIVAGTGNNGGDGFVLANLLLNKDCKVSVSIIGDQSKISGDAKLAFDHMSNDAELLSDPDFDEYDLIVDAIFGAGLTRDIEGHYAEFIETINASATPVLAVDLPSGVNGKSGVISGCAVQADVTATFFRYKPGHFLYPGRQLCGEVFLGQIGITEDVLTEIAPSTYLNAPALWQDQYPFLTETGHKYNRGHALAISGGLDKSGAARLMAKAALRIGAGLVTIACPSETMAAHAAHSDAIMLTQMDCAQDLECILGDNRINAISVGPGLDPNHSTRDLVKLILKSKRSVVLDAGALTAFSLKPDELFNVIKTRSAPTILTPHDGEFARLFPDLASENDKLAKTISAAQRADATILLKGPDSVIANANGNAAISNNAPPWLATAGSGDVLCGMICGLLAQGMAEFEAACAGVWFHGEAGKVAGPGLISSDLEQALHKVIQDIYEKGFD
ncbi:MAG: NAD(P)H-hydrate dehydratase [Rhizobiaceae bacterium]|nr:NAD(P)H-hydrate dehydratase [Rhizobiaceae bacterium]